MDMVRCYTAQSETDVHVEVKSQCKMRLQKVCEESKLSISGAIICSGAALFAGSFPRASLLQQCHVSSHALCSGWTHFYKPPSAAEGQTFLMYLLSYFLIFLLFLFSFYQYPPINHMFHGLLETPIHQLRTGVLWSLQHFSDLFKGLVLNSCTRDTFLLPVAIQTWAVHTSWRQQLPVSMLAAGRTGWCCIEKWFHYCQAQFGLSSHRIPARTAAKL